MAYTTLNFQTKKALKDAVTSGAKLTIFQPGAFTPNCKQNGTVSIIGPHYSKPRKWQAKVEVKNSIIIKVE